MEDQLFMDDFCNKVVVSSRRNNKLDCSLHMMLARGATTVDEKVYGLLWLRIESGYFTPS
eukprot:478344-Pleurochrysis_carterae.AAC.1